MKNNAITTKIKKLLDILIQSKIIIKAKFNCYEEYYPENIMKIFNNTCLKTKIKIYYEFSRDLPWEILIF